MKMSFRNLLSLLTMAALFHGVMELKTFLMENFVDNDTKIKRQVNQALNGGFPVPERKEETQAQEISVRKPEKSN